MAMISERGLPINVSTVGMNPRVDEPAERIDCWLLSMFCIMQAKPSLQFSWSVMVDLVNVLDGSLRQDWSPSYAMPG